MQFDDFKRIATTFADEDEWVEIEEDHLFFKLHGEVVEADVLRGPDGIRVKHEGEVLTAARWIRSYLSRLDRLAQRIIDHVSPPEDYVSPKVDLIDRKNELVGFDSEAKLRECLTESSADKTSIYFLTSDEGEGKTSLIEKISVEQATAFKDKKTSSLIIPISLDGRTLLRLDDVFIVSLMNRLRFPHLYYDSFLELVRMNAIIPAFDGFEEVLVDAGSGKAPSEIGNFISQLSSTGTLIFAAKNAYFESSLDSQAKLLDSIRPKQDVEIRRIILNPWNRKIFLKYASKRDVPSPDRFYDRVKNHLGRGDHPAFTRAVLVQRLIDIAKEADHFDEFLQRLSHSKEGHLFNFIEFIIERENNDRWVNGPGTGDLPLLTVEEHHELLSQIALVMCDHAVDVLGLDMIESIVGYFLGEKDEDQVMQWQIARYILDHPLMRQDLSQDRKQRITRVRFDHDCFQQFYLGQGIARSLSMSDDSIYAKHTLDARALTKLEIQEVTRYLRKMSEEGTVSIDKCLDDLQQLSKRERRVSCVRENIGVLMLELAQYAKQFRSVSKINFPVSALRELGLQNFKISNSFFCSTSLDKSKIIDCEFDKCYFSELIINQEYELDGTVFNNCKFDSVVVYGGLEGDRQVFSDPDRVCSILRSHKLNLRSTKEVISEEVIRLSNNRDMEVVYCLAKTVRVERRSRDKNGVYGPLETVETQSLFNENELVKTAESGQLTVSSRNGKLYYNEIVSVDFFRKNTGNGAYYKGKRPTPLTPEEEQTARKFAEIQLGNAGLISVTGPHQKTNGDWYFRASISNWNNITKLKEWAERDNAVKQRLLEQQM